MGPLFIVTERFDQSRGDSWHSYVESFGLDQVAEVVSLDASLCPTVVSEVDDADWPHVVNESFMLDYFTDLEYLLGRCDGIEGRNLLCVFRNPEVLPVPPDTSWGFRFEGCDLVDVQGGVSALSNCGGFPKAFANTELSSCGLLSSLERAQEVQRALKCYYPSEAHADCHVWAVFRASQLHDAD